MSDSRPDKLEKNVQEGLGMILERVAGFFDIFDLSFFVSGVASAGALAACGRVLGLRSVELRHEWMLVGLVVAGCYVTGVMSFALGRAIRKIFFRRTSNGLWWLRRSLHENFLWSKPFVQPFLAQGAVPFPHEDAPLTHAQSRTLSLIYTRMWVEMRSRPSLQPSLKLVLRYWVMEATCDGLAFASILWLVALGLRTSHHLGQQPLALTIPGFLLGLAGFLAFLYEANRYKQYQVEEISVTLAAQEPKG